LVDVVEGLFNLVQRVLDNSVLASEFFTLSFHSFVDRASGSFDSTFPRFGHLSVFSPHEMTVKLGTFFVVTLPEHEVL
jgi:hypothetical protein